MAILVTGRRRPGIEARVGNRHEKELPVYHRSGCQAPGSAHPYAHLWDNGSSAVDELRRIMDIRAWHWKDFSAGSYSVGSPLANMERTLVPVYFLHRYQVEAAVKLIGGVDYNYAMRGDGQFALQKGRS